MGKQLLKSSHLYRYARKKGCWVSVPVESIVPCCSTVRYFRNGLFWSYLHFVGTLVLSPVNNLF